MNCLASLGLATSPLSSKVVITWSLSDCSVSRSVVGGCCSAAAGAGQVGVVGGSGQVLVAGEAVLRVDVAAELLDLGLGVGHVGGNVVLHAADLADETVADAEAVEVVGAHLELAADAQDERGALL